MSTRDRDGALAAWRDHLGGDRVLDADEAGRRYALDTGTFRRVIAGALLVRDRAELPEIVRIAQSHRVPLYPISRGNNWGYGTANPVTDHAIVVDLSAMDRIVDFDSESGSVTLEPGVSQRQLSAFLEKNGHPFMVPVTGAGPDGSLLGNALERGYGITPFTDHFGAMRALKAVLPSGDEYVGPLQAAGVEAASAFKWGIGPYLDGLFCQGAFGIVTEMTIALARRPEALTAFFFWIDRDERLEAGVLAIRDVIRAVGGNLGGVNLMNSVRLVAMETAYPFDTVGRGAALSTIQLAALTRKIGVSAWMGAGAIYGAPEVNRAVKDVVKRILKPHADRIVFFDRTMVKRAERVASFVPGAVLARAKATLSRMSAGIRLLDGYPSRMALPLAYWKRPGTRDAEQAENPARDGCGLLWYSPLVPMKPPRVRAFVTEAQAIMAEHKFEPLITLTSLSDAVFDSTMPILFDGRDEASTGRAEACYRALFAAGKRAGFAPYRIPVQLMDLVVDPKLVAFDLGRRLKHAIDPNGILAPGRYVPIGDPD